MVTLAFAGPRTGSFPATITGIRGGSKVDLDVTLVLQLHEKLPLGEGRELLGEVLDDLRPDLFQLHTLHAVLVALVEADDVLLAHLPDALADLGLDELVPRDAAGGGFLVEKHLGDELVQGETSRVVDPLELLDPLGDRNLVDLGQRDLRLADPSRHRLGRRGRLEVGLGSLAGEGAGQSRYRTRDDQVLDFHGWRTPISKIRPSSLAEPGVPGRFGADGTGRDLASGSGTAPERARR